MASTSVSLTSLSLGVTPKTLESIFGAKGLIKNDTRFDGMSQSVFLRVAIAHAIKFATPVQINLLISKCHKPDSFESLIKSLRVSN